MLAPPRTAPIELRVPVMRTSATSSLDHHPMSLSFLSSTSLVVSARRPKLSLDISASSSSPRPLTLPSPLRNHKSPLTMRPYPSSLRSPSPAPAPYVLPLGSKSILRNGPLPRRRASATPARGSRRLFPAPKRVGFREDVIEIVPAPVVELSSSDELDCSSDGGSSHENASGLSSRMSKAVGHGQKRRKTSRAALREEHDEGGNNMSDSSPRVQRPWKRSKDWIWTMGAWDDVQLYDSPEEGAPPMDRAPKGTPFEARVRGDDEADEADEVDVEEFDGSTTTTLPTIASTMLSGHKRTPPSHRTASSAHHPFPPNPLRLLERSAD